MENLRPGRIYAIVILIVVLGLVVSVAGGVAAGGAMAYYLGQRQVPRIREIASVPVTTAPAVAIKEEPIVIAADEGEQSYEQIYEQTNPSVVNIVVAVKGQVIPFSPFGGPRIPQDRYQYGSASGFVYDRDGHIITNNHVVAEADKIRVTFADGTTVPATVVGRDPDSDLAVIKVATEELDLRPVELGDSDKLKVGQRVIAIGNPFGLEGTLTTGVVSALGRSLPTSETEVGTYYTIPDVIQTDAAINPGNSGGPLLDTQGRVIGVNFAIESSVRSSAGVGFAIPVNLVKQVVPVLIETGRYQHPWLGVSVITLSPDMAEAMKLPRNQRGALVAEVTPNSPAATAGLRASKDQITIEGQSVPVGGDVIVAIEGYQVKKSDDLIYYLVRHTKVGQEIKLTVLRGGNTVTINATLTTRPARS